MAFSCTTLFVGVCFVGLLLGCSFAQLTTNFYGDSCPLLLPTIREQIKIAVEKETRMGASILRLFFHDCFVNGCDASLLLDDTPTLKGEKTAGPNNNSVRGFEVIDTIKSAVEKVCPGIVSCSDILAVSSRDSVVQLGGPYWDVKLGRRDSLKAFQALANTSIPAPTSNLSKLISSFQAEGLSKQDLVALSGSHTIGFARCTTFRGRVYNETNIDKSFASTLQTNCPKTVGSGDNNLAPLDHKTPACFDNSYYNNLIAKRGLLHSDQQLYNGGSADSLVMLYKEDPKTFYQHFVEGMIKMGDIKPLTGSNGQIRKNCRMVN